MHRRGGSTTVSLLLALVVAGSIWAILLAHELGHAIVARNSGATVGCIRVRGLAQRLISPIPTLSDRAVARTVAAGPLVTAFCYCVLVGIAHVDLLVAARHIGTLIAPLLVLAGYTLTVGVPQYLVLLRAGAAAARSESI